MLIRVALVVALLALSGCSSGTASGQSTTSSVPVPTLSPGSSSTTSLVLVPTTVEVSDDEIVRQLIVDYYEYEFDTSTDAELVPRHLIAGSLADFQYGLSRSGPFLGGHFRTGPEAMVAIVGTQRIPHTVGQQPHVEALVCAVLGIEFVNDETGATRSLGGDTPEFATVDALKGPEGWRLHNIEPFEWNDSRDCDPNAKQ